MECRNFLLLAAPLTPFKKTKAVKGAATIFGPQCQLFFIKCFSFLLGETLNSSLVIKGEKMSIFDKAKEIGGKVSNSVTAFSSDEVIANTIIKAVEKQEKVNTILKEKGSNYLICDIELGMGIPPSVTFGVRRMNESSEIEAIEYEQSANNFD